jgi:hypothetical protein
MAKEAQAAMGASDLTAIADRGYFKGEEVLACEAAGVTPLVPKPLTSGAKADGRFGKPDFVYDPQEDAYRCPGGEKTHASVYDHRGRAHAALLLDDQMRQLRSETPMHAVKGAARQAVGARSRSRCDAGAVGPHAHPPLPDAHARKGENGNEPSRSRL